MSFWTMLHQDMSSVVSEVSSASGLMSQTLLLEDRLRVVSEGSFVSGIKPQSILLEDRSRAVKSESRDTGYICIKSSVQSTMPSDSRRLGRRCRMSFCTRAA